MDEHQCKKQEEGKRLYALEKAWTFPRKPCSLASSSPEWFNRVTLHACRWVGMSRLYSIRRNRPRKDKKQLGQCPVVLALSNSKGLSERTTRVIYAKIRQCYAVIFHGVGGWVAHCARGKLIKVIEIRWGVCDYGELLSVRMYVDPLYKYWQTFDGR